MPNISSKPATIIYPTGLHLPEEWVSDPQVTNMSGKEYLLGALGISALKKDTEIESSLLPQACGICRFQEKTGGPQ